MKKERFGYMPDGTEISLYLSVSDLGALLVRLCVPDKNGRKADIVLGFDSGEEYLDNPNCLGAIVVPVANRTRNASVVIDGTEYHMTVNEGSNNLHSDKKSFVTMWDVAAQGEDFITFAQERADMSDGLPGDRRFEVTYTLLADGVRVAYHVTSTRPTYINPTNHSYFNLAGEASGSILDQTLRMYAAEYTPLAEEQIPSGQIVPVKGTAFDFLTPKTFGLEMESTEPQMVLAGGYDHNFVIEGYTGDGSMLTAACASDPATCPASSSTQQISQTSKTARTEYTTESAADSAWRHSFSRTMSTMTTSGKQFSAEIQIFAQLLSSVSLPQNDPQYLQQLRIPAHGGRLRTDDICAPTCCDMYGSG